MKRMISLALACAFSFLAVSNAHALVNVTAVGVGNYMGASASVLTSTMPITGKLTWGGGALFGFKLNPFLTLEAGGLFAPRKSSIDFSILDASLPSATKSYNAIQIPALLRVTAIPLLSFGAGMYYSVGMGSVTSEVTGSAPSTQTFAEARLKSSDYGLVGSVAFRLPLAPMFGFVVDGRFNYGLANLATDAGVSLKAREAQVLAGLNFNL